jgi:hypothetical protein
MSVLIAEIGRSAATIVHVGQHTGYGQHIPMSRDLDRWLSYYRNHRRWTADLAMLAAQDAGAIGVHRHFTALIDALRSLPDGVEDIRHPAYEDCGRRILDGFEALREMTPPPLSPAALAHPSFQGLWYFVSVQIPCTLLFQTQPGHLMRRARHGDLAVLSQMVLLDRSVVYEPGISRVIHAAPAGWQVAQGRRLSHVRPPRPARWKVMAAGTMRLLADVTHTQLTYQEIIALFHAMARDCDDLTRDRDLGSLAERTFERQVAEVVRCRQALLAPPMPPPAPGQVVNERISRERIRSSASRT